MKIVRARSTLPVVTAVLALIWTGLAAWFFVGQGWGAIATVKEACGAPPPDLLFAPAPDETRAFIAGCRDADGLTAYRRMETLDLIYPAVVGAMLVGAMLVAAGARRRLWWFGVVPAVATLADYVENAGVWAMILDADGGWAPRMIQLASGVKVIASSSAWIILAALVLARFWKPRDGRRGT